MRKLTICMYGAANENIDPLFIQEGEALGREIASRGHALIFGGGGVGLMGACARGMTAEKGTIIGVLPDFMKDYEQLYTECTQVIITKTMSERKEIMEERADAFIITPGGVGTMDEFFQIITLAGLDQTSAPIVIFNIDGYYNSIINFLNEGMEKGFINANLRDLYCVKNTAEEVVDAIEYKLNI